MELLKKFLQTKVAKRFAWGFLNVLMGMLIAFLAYLVSNNVAWAGIALAFATPLSQALTKYLNS